MPTRTRRSQPRQGPTRPIPEDFSGEVLPSRSSNRPVRSRWRSGQSDIMPSSTKFSQTRYAAAARPPQARPRAHTHASARAPRRRAAPTACRRPPPRALAARRAVRRRAARARPRRARRPRALAREKPPPHCGTAAAVETNLETFTSASGGVRDEPAPPHRSRRRRRARRSRASTRRPPPRHCAKSAGAAAFGVMSAAADLRLWVGHTAGTDALCSTAAAVDAMSGLWRAERHPVVRRRAQNRLSPWCRFPGRSAAGPHLRAPLRFARDRAQKL